MLFKFVCRLRKVSKNENVQCSQNQVVYIMRVLPDMQKKLRLRSHQGRSDLKMAQKIQN